MERRRDSGRLILPEYHLILSEGKQTEPNYFQALQKHIAQKLGPNDRGQISLLVSEKPIPLKDMFKEAEAYLRLHPAKPIKHIWLVYDKDEVKPDLFNAAVHECRKRTKGGGPTYHALWSNECIELWFLLHFIPLDACIPRKQYFDKLSELLGRPYQKNDPGFFESLLPLLPNARQRAKTLRNRYKGADCAKMCPCTTVYELFDKLAPYI